MNIIKKIGAGILLSLLASPQFVRSEEKVSLQIGRLTCEHLSNPLGIDVRKPRLSWVVESSGRAQSQGAYQVLVASSQEILKTDKGDLWDSGIVKKDQTQLVAYDGAELASRKACYWKVRSWDQQGNVSPWSAPAFWTMGLLEPADWQAQWIGGKKEWATIQTNGFHAGPAAGENDVKWVQVSLAKEHPIDKIKLFPACPVDVKPQTPGFGFPLRFRVDVSNDPEFKNFTTVADHTGQDFKNPGVKPVLIDVANVKATYVRLTATKIWNRQGGIAPLCFAMAELEVYSNGINVAVDATVSVKDSVEVSGWGKDQLIDGVVPSQVVETNGYHAAAGAGEFDEKWVQISLPAKAPIDRITLIPTCPSDVKPRTPGFAFPVRFRVAIADNPAFENSKIVADYTDKDYPNPGDKSVEINANGAVGNYVRVTATKLWNRKVGLNPLCFALAEVEVYSDGKNIAGGAKVTSKDSVEGWGWSSESLTDGYFPSERESEKQFAESPWLRKNFELTGKPDTAYAYVASIGYHELYVNGNKVSTAVLSPSISELGKRARYMTYDIAPYLKAGKNVIGLWLGAGWARSQRFHQAYRPLVQAQIEIGLGRDATHIPTDATWKIHPSNTALLGPWAFGNYGGELIDARRNIPAWSSESFDDAMWTTADCYRPKVKVTAEKIEANVKSKELSPVAVNEKEAGVYQIDMGKNFTGWVEVALSGRPGDEAILSFSERPEAEMAYGMQSRYIFGASGQGTFQNRFNYVSARYITLKGASQKPKLEDIKGYVIRNNFAPSADFTCSNQLLNQIYSTARWTVESLSLGGYFVDCHNRERWGYGAEGQVMTYATVNNYQVAAFLTKWCEDWRDVQAADGNLPYTAPTYDGGGGPGWSGICVTLPWEIYLRYGDQRILAESYPTMQKWLAFLDTKVENNLLCKWGGEWDFLGDWVAPGKNQGAKRPDENSTLLFNNCYYLLNLSIAGQVASLLGKTDEAADYQQKAEKVRAAAHQRFFQSDNSYASGEQSYQAFPLYVNLPPEAQRAAVMKYLEDNILTTKQGHIDTGVLGTHYLLRLLAATGRSDLAIQMASQTDFPSWGDMLQRGATCLWEQWDGENAILHSSFVSVAGWFIEGVLGIQPDPAGPGYKKFFVRPPVTDHLKWARGSFHSPQGTILSDWIWQDGIFTLKLTVPFNSTATVFFPAKENASILENGKPLNADSGPSLLRREGDIAVLLVKSGSYTITSKGPTAKSE